MRSKSLKAVLLVALTVPLIFMMLPGTSQMAAADITCQNSDYNCIYIDITDGSNGNRIVCTRAVCGGGSFGGRQYQLEGLYAFDGPNPNDTTSTSASSSTSSVPSGESTSTSSTTVSGGLTVSLNGAVVTVSCNGTFYYSGGTYTDSGFSRAWNATSRSGDTACGYSGSFDSSNLQGGQTYYIRATYYHSSGSVTVTGSFVAVAATTTTTTIRPVTTTTVAGARVNPCIDPANPNFACGWAILGPNNQVGGVIVCTFAVCGSGSFGGMRLALQAQQQEGGNVAGYSGGTYDEATQTFNLGGGGTLRSGDKLEEAVFPTTTTVAQSARPVDGPEAVTAIVAETGKLYKNSESYVKGESEVTETAEQVVVQIPPLTVSEVGYSVRFNPDGPAPALSVASGKIKDGLVIPDTEKKLTAELNNSGFTHVGQNTPTNQRLTSLVNSTRIVIPKKSFSGRSGSITIALSNLNQSYGSVNTRVLAPRKYSSCRALIVDYPGGVASPASRTRVDNAVRAQWRVQPTINLRTFKLNKHLDINKNRVACEASGGTFKQS